MCYGKADEEQTGHWHALVEHGPHSAGRRGFLALEVMFCISTASRICISVLTDHSIIPENYINHAPKTDLLFPLFFLPSFPTSSHLLLDAWVDLD